MCPELRNATAASPILWHFSIPIWTAAYWMILFFTFHYGRLHMQKEILAEQLERDQMRWNAQLVALQDLAAVMIKYQIDPAELRPIVERGFTP